jgi:hypothetical protein
MAYFHIDRTRAYVDSLGLSRSLRAKPQKVRANAIPADNSFYSSLTQSMTLGAGGVDDGEDADVIVHEYGHSLQDQAVKGFGRSIGAGSMGEGFGDYLTAAMSSLVTGGDARFDACVFDWDSVSYSDTGCGRRTDRFLTLRRAERRCLREIHCMGEAWSGLLYELRGTLGDGPGGARVSLHARQALRVRRRRAGAARRRPAPLRRRTRAGARGGVDRAPVLQAVGLLSGGAPGAPGAPRKEVAR